jgi:hypothetical protein
MRHASTPTEMSHRINSVPHRHIYVLYNNYRAFCPIACVQFELAPLSKDLLTLPLP